MTISLCESSVDVFVPYLGNLSALLDHAAAYARAKNIDPAILLNLRLAPNMYQVADTAAIDFVRSLPRAEINRAGDKEVVFTFKNRATRKFTGRSLLLMFSVPQFFLHVTTAYDILRHAGVDLAKDFLGPARQA